MKKIKLAIKNSWKVFLAALVSLVVGIIFLSVFLAIDETWALITAAVFLFFAVAFTITGWEFAKDTFHLICRDCKEVMILNSYKPSYRYSCVSCQGKDFTFLVTIVCPHCGAENTFKQKVYGPTMAEAESNIRRQIYNLLSQKFLFEKHSHNKKGNNQSRNSSTSSEEVSTQNGVDNHIEKRPEFQNSGVLQVKTETSLNTNVISQKTDTNNTTKTGGLIAGMVICYALFVNGSIPTMILAASVAGQLQMFQEGSSDFPTASFIGMLIAIIVFIGSLCLGIVLTMKFVKIRKTQNAASQNVRIAPSGSTFSTPQQPINASQNSSSVPNPDFANDLIKLNELRKSGVISEEDYQTAKENVLHRLDHK